MNMDLNYLQKEFIDQIQFLRKELADIKKNRDCGICSGTLESQGGQVVQHNINMDIEKVLAIRKQIPFYFLFVLI